MRSAIERLLEAAIAALVNDPVHASLATLPVQIERARDTRHGDFASNLAMRAAKALGRNPREIAQLITDAFPASPLVAKVEVAGPGFVNITLNPNAYHDEIHAVLTQGSRYGSSTSGKGKRVLLEFLSANPTGPLHVGHGRHAAFGASLANLLSAVGYNVDTEYYVNDAGRQMDILAVSVWLRYVEHNGYDIEFPGNAYQGDYCKTIAGKLAAQYGDQYLGGTARLQTLIADTSLEPEAQLDALIALAKTELGRDGFEVFFAAAKNEILDDIRADLAEFGVHYDRWYSERSLEENGAIQTALNVLDERGLLYKKDGATWFRTTDFGDDKDRVVIRDNGAKTYFASDIAYHYEKFERGYDLLVNAFGSDHHGYIARVRAGIAGLDKPADALEVRLVQFVVLFRGEEKVQMTTRGGTYVTLRDLRNEVGNDAARFFYVSRSNDQHLEFDLELAKTQSNDNPVYYVQYAHARIASTLRKLVEAGGELPADDRQALGPLTATEEIDLMREVSRYPEVVQLAADHRAPQMIVQYLRSLAAEFHSFYNAQRILADDPAVRNARGLLALATQQVLANGLALVGVSAPTSM